MGIPRGSLIAVGVAAVLLAGCGTTPATGGPGETVPTSNPSPTPPPAAEPTPRLGEELSDVVIPAGAYAAGPDFAFPVPEGWTVLDPFVEGRLGKDVSIDGSVEYPGDARDAADTYLAVLTAAGFEASTYAPGELTHQASLSAEGRVGGASRFAILNFDVHADGLQRVSITIVERD